MPKWTLSTEFTIDSAHYIRDYDGPCGQVHGHTYRIRLEAQASRLYTSEFLPHEAMVADFRTLRCVKQNVRKVELEHALHVDFLPP